jgi:hypothetical protein
MCVLILPEGGRQMPDQPGDPNIPRPGYPPLEVPTIYADGVTSLVPGSQIVKFYLARIEPNFEASSPNSTQVCAQIVMPIVGFVQLVGFFENAIGRMIKTEALSQTQVDELMAKYRDDPE